MVQYGERERPSPRFIAPMECLRVDRLPTGPDWVYEVKWDGYRTLAIKDGKDALLFSYQGNSHTEQFPWVLVGLRHLPIRRFVLDGEMVALGEDGTPNFQELQNWRTTKRPIVYMVFDVLHFEGKDLMGLPLLERRTFVDRLR